MSQYIHLIFLSYTSKITMSNIALYEKKNIESEIRVRKHNNKQRNLAFTMAVTVWHANLVQSQFSSPPAVTAMFYLRYCVERFAWWNECERIDTSFNTNFTNLIIIYDFLIWKPWRSCIYTAIGRHNIVSTD